MKLEKMSDSDRRIVEDIVSKPSLYGGSANTDWAWKATLERDDRIIDGTWTESDDNALDGMFEAHMGLLQSEASSMEGTLKPGYISLAVMVVLGYILFL